MTSPTVIRDPRSPWHGPARFETEAGDAGIATWRDLSRVGAGLALGRYLKPGRRVRLWAPALAEWERDHVFTAVVCWCRPTPDAARFTAGVRLLRPDPALALAWAGLVHRAQRGAEAGRPATYWGSFRESTRQQRDAGAAQPGLAR